MGESTPSCFPSLNVFCQSDKQYDVLPDLFLYSCALAAAKSGRMSFSLKISFGLESRVFEFSMQEGNYVQIFDALEFLKTHLVFNDNKSQVCVARSGLC